MRASSLPLAASPIDSNNDPFNKGEVLRLGGRRMGQPQMWEGVNHQVAGILTTKLRNRRNLPSVGGAVTGDGLAGTTQQHPARCPMANHVRPPS